MIINASVYTDIALGYARGMSVLGDAIQARRKPLMTQTALGQRLGLKQSAVSQWETGETMPDATQLVRLAGVLGCRIDELVSGIDAKYDRVVRVTHPVTRPLDNRALHPWHAIV